MHDSGTVRWNNADSNTAGYSRYKDDPLHVLEASIDLLELGRRIRCAREINGRSQEAFADVCRLDRSYFLEIKRGESNLTFNILSQICSGLNCDLASLTKGIPQIVAAPQKTQVVSGLPTTRRGPMFSRRFCEKRPWDRSHEIWWSFPLS
jgi:transcriptional regulator with XRE-family HTH domain